MEGKIVELKRGFKTSEVSRLTGLTSRQLDHWDRTGLFKPSLASAAGKGSTRFYSFLDVVQLRVARELRAAGVSLHALKLVIEYLRTEGLKQPLAEAKLVVSGSDVLLVRGQSELVSVLNAPGQGVLQLVLDLPRMVKKVEQEVSKLKEPA